MNSAKEPISIVKIGGNIIADEKKLEHFLVDFAAIKGKKILIHGGGKLATELAEKLGVPSKLFNGRRITDLENLKVVTMVYGGFTNKNIVAILQKNDCNALGVSGADGNLIQAHKRTVKDVDYGYVGDIDAVNASFLEQLINIELTPVVCAITHDKNGQLLNTNADTIASEIAVACSKYYEVSLFFCFEKKGVLKNINDEHSLITHINEKSYQYFVDRGIITEGMLPKLHNAFYALNKGVEKVCLGNEKMITSKNEDFTLLSL